MAGATSQHLRTRVADEGVPCLNISVDFLGRAVSRDKRLTDTIHVDSGKTCAPADVYCRNEPIALVGALWALVD